MSAFPLSAKLTNSVKTPSSSRVPVIHELEEVNHGASIDEGDLSRPTTSEASFKRPKLQRKNSETEQRLASMRERFSMLQMMEEGDQESSPMVTLDVAAPNRDSPMAVSAPNSASSRWSKIRKVVHWPKQQQQSLLIGATTSRKNSFGTLSAPATSLRGTPLISSPTDSPQLSPRQLSPRLKRKVIKRPSEGDLEQKVEDAAMANIELEDTTLGQLWTDDDIVAFEAPPDVPSLSLISDREEFEGVMTAEVFNEDSEQLRVTVSRIPEAVVQAKKEEIERKVQEERLQMLQKLRDREKDIDHREISAKDAVQAKEQEARRRLDAEKQKAAALALKKQRNLAQDFRKMREELEVGIKRQQGAVKEHFGKMLVHEETLARRFQAASKMSPQPVEIRIHLMRAVKNKLPKGLYVLMLTQYDAIGGRPLSWSRIGSNGIGNMRPGITRTCKHEGRYFDRILRVEDSCFALCPPRPLLKPNFVFVLELFQLESKHNPTDKIEAWTALPMSYESMSLIEGKFKLPMLRGEHSQSVQQFKTMERMMASDLHNWLCNIYIEVRHMSLNELGASDEMLMTTDFDMDYFNKSFIPLDVDGNPVLSRAQQEQLALERDLEAAGFPTSSVSGKHPPGMDGSTHSESQSHKVRAQEASRILQQSENDAYNVPLLPIDKGIFRRKLGGAPQGSTTDGGDEDVQYGNTVSALGMSYASSGKSGSSGAAQPSSLSQQQSQAQLQAQQAPLLAAQDGNDSDGDAKKKYTKSGKLSSIKEDGPPNSASTRSLMGFLGLSKNASANVSANNSSRNNSSKHSSNTPLLLKNDDNFLEHRKLLVQRWRENIKNKYPHQPRSRSPSPSPSSKPNGSSFVYEKDEEVLERGYNIQDEVFLHREQRGKLPGVETLSSKEDRQWAAAGLEGKIVRRWQSEGPRFDSEAVPEPDLEEGSVNGNNDNLNHQRSHAGGQHSPGTEPKIWEELRDVREMEDYTMSICADPSRKKSVVPGSKSASKLRYIHQEMFGDFNYYLWGTFEFYMAVFIYLFALWIRIYVHYLAQYLYLWSLRTPVFDFRLMVFQVTQKYMSASISVAGEVGVVAMGPVANVCVYICMVGLAMLFQKTTTHMPDVLSKFFIAFGFASILDPLLVIVIDLIYHNYDCTKTSDACAENYTGSACNCFNGDFAKLWYRMRIEEGSGLTGLFITVLLYMGTGIIGMLLLYQYIVYVHRDGRVLDMWRRINGTVEEFFLPLDFEVSDEELQTIVHKAVHWRGPKGSKRRLEVQEYTEMDPQDPHYLEQYKKFIVVEIDEKKNKSVFREFVLEPSGAILEVFEARNASYRNRSIFSKEMLEGYTDREGEGDSPEDEHSRRSPRTARSDRSGGDRSGEKSGGSRAVGSQRGAVSPRDQYRDPQRGVQILSEERSPLLGANAGGSAKSGKGPPPGPGNFGESPSATLLRTGSALSTGSNRRSPSARGTSSRKALPNLIVEGGDNYDLYQNQDEDNHYDSVDEINPVPKRSLSYKSDDGGFD